MSRRGRAAIAELLREHGLRVTPQRRAIWGVFAQAPGHLSAEDVFQRARRELPERARATVYNALNEFLAAGLLTRLPGEASHLFDPNVERHHHFRCRRCRRLFDVQPSGVEDLRLAEDGFVVEQAHIVFEGVCAECASAGRERRAVSRA